MNLNLKSNMGSTPWEGNIPLDGIVLLEWWATEFNLNLCLRSGYISEGRTLGLPGLIKLGKELLEEKNLAVVALFT